MAVPEGETEGQPDTEAAGEVVGVLPEGTHSLVMQAYWSVTEANGEFRGGAVDLGYHLEHTRS